MSQIIHKGMVLIIDEQFGKNDGNDRIDLIANKIASQNIPFWACLGIEEAEKILQNMYDVNFIIMDWNLKDVPIEVNVPENLNTAANILFLRNLRKYCFAPVFILSSEPPNEIIEKIIAADSTLYNSKDKNSNFIFVESKESVVEDGALFKIINDWVGKNPTIYTLKAWENSFYTAKNKSFWNLFYKNPLWPKILWDAYKQDSINESVNIYDVVNKLIIGSIDKRIFEEKYMQNNSPVIDVVDVKKVIAGTMYVDNAYLPVDDIQPGDVFEFEKGYLINVRAECDTIVRNGTKLGDLKLYLLRCSKIENKVAWDGRYSEQTGIVQRMTDFCIFGIDDDNFYRIKYKDIKVKKYSKLKRIKRLLPPHINYLQQGYAAYSSRVGLPRIPDGIIQEVIGNLK